MRRGTTSDRLVRLMPSYIRTRPAERLISDEEMLRLYIEEELDSETISYRAGCSGKTVLEIIRKLGGVVRGRGGRNERKTLKLTDAEIVQRYNDGASGLTLAKQADCDHATIYRVLHRHGVRTRTPAESGTAARARDRLDRTKN
jgi:CobQ-like glutamine amidotransferase family enzyme